MTADEIIDAVIAAPDAWRRRVRSATAEGSEEAAGAAGNRIDLYIASHTQGGQDKSKHRHRCQCPSLSGYGAKGGGQMVPPAHPRHAAICFVTRLPGWRSRPPPWWAMVGSLRESISSYATIYAPAAAQQRMELHYLVSVESLLTRIQ